jgi:hypothetical protein
VPDFHTLLKQSIIDRGITDGGQRRAIYAQARAAYLRQITQRNPAIDEDALAARLAAFDAAVERIEADLANELAVPDEAATAAFEEAVLVGDDPRYDEYDEGAEAYSDEPDLPPHLRSDQSWPEHHEQAEPARGAFGRALHSLPGGGREAEEPLPPAPEAAAEPPRQSRRDRWSEPPGATANSRLAPRRRLVWTISERDKVRILIGAIGTLAVVLAGVIIYLLLPSSDSSVTLPINERREVSDAATAARIAGETLDVRQTFTVFDGRDPTIFQATPNNPVRLERDAEGGFARISTSVGAAGVKVAVGPGLASRLAGQNVRIVLTVRASAERGAANLRFAYQSGVAISHWQTANLGPRFATVGLVWRVPALRTSTTGADYIIIEPGIPGDGTAADIRSVKIDLLGSAPET